VIVVELLALAVGGTEVFWLGEVELELLVRAELELLVGVELELVLALEPLKILDRVVDVTVMLTDEHGVVGFALAHAQREPAASRTLPAEAPQALSTQFKAAD